MTMDTVETLKNLLVQTGAAWVLWLLMLLSAVSLALAVERFLYFRARSDDLRGLAAMLDAHLRAGSRQEAISALGALRSAGAAVALAGLRLADRGPAAAEKAMASAMAIERKSLEARLVFLGTLGNNAPFIGLFGTVIGVILAFEELGKAQTAAGTATQAASQAVMGAIAEALVATAAGIAVALPAVALYNWFQRRIAVILLDAEALSSLVLAYLSDTTARVEAPVSPMPRSAAAGGQ
ncbi:MotA/TolQ/ExbB proton channel family protein [Archangium gephyra]|uniref:MotA/TolQ/ExbB proton channel family protein n=1 Tax=Archangium gephyra TaxID=48 RepID=UPI003B7C2213